MTAVRAAFVSVLLLLASAPVASAGNPSFDCESARSDVQRLICGDDELAAMDLQLARAFAGALARASAQGVTDLQHDQDSWVETRDRCSRAADMRACTLSAYAERLGQL
jgi:uncharacterized protein